MSKIKIFDGKWGGKTVKLKFELDFHINDNIDITQITEEQIRNMVFEEDRTDLGELVLNNLKDAIIVRE